jgi:hypothetical protein
MCVDSDPFRIYFILTYHGIQNDRKWCIVTADTHDIVTAREISKVRPSVRAPYQRFFRFQQLN